ncbi:MAG: glycosyl hydrolase [Nitrosomonadales bacterium]|nr:MAG: glycosyl hydrolase [Nitrosomonadales bacterium]
MLLSYFMFFLLLFWGGLLGFYAKDLLRNWREPVLRHPVVIFESDDWGAGPLDQAKSLEKLREILAAFKDVAGRAPAATLGIILAIADTRRIRDMGGHEYFSASLAEPLFDPLREAMLEGARQGVFALHLHGMEHYWPPALMEAAAKDVNVRGWLQSDGIPGTEALPSALQSGWTDASVLPSQALSSEALHAAISEEASQFFACFNERPRVAVATTFVWTEEVEIAWARSGIEVIITPGARYTCRDETGKPGGADKRMANGELSRSGQIYLVRDAYFEPTLGHTPEQLLRDVKEHVRLGRPCLVEMHRFNFIGTAEKRDASLHALKTALQQLQSGFPDLRFMTSLELAEAIRAKVPVWVETKTVLRINVWLRRIGQIRGFSRLAGISGLAIPLWLIGKVTR